MSKIKTYVCYACSRYFKSSNKPMKCKHCGSVKIERYEGTM